MIFMVGKVGNEIFKEKQSTRERKIKNMIIITSGKGNIDIDAYGGAIAYAYLLNLKEW